MRKKHNARPELITLESPGRFGSVDITDKMPKACLQCPHQDLTVNVHKLYANGVGYMTTVEVVCSNRHVCNYIMEMMKCDEQADSPT